MEAEILLPSLDSRNWGFKKNTMWLAIKWMIWKRYCCKLPGSELSTVLVSLLKESPWQPCLVFFIVWHPQNLRNHFKSGFTTSLHLLALDKSCSTVAGLRSFLLIRFVSDFLSSQRLSAQHVPKASPFWGSVWITLMQSGADVIN